MTANHTLSYKPPWKFLIDRKINKTQSQELVGISPVTLSKLGRRRNVTTDSLIKICETFNCNIADVCEVVPTNPKGETK